MLTMSHLQPCIRDLLAEATALLEESDSPGLDAQLLLAKVLGKSRTWLHSWPEHYLTGEQVREYRQLVEERLHGQPVAYLLGHREFWSLRLQVGPAVLVPRPETELLVETAFELVQAEKAVVADLGTGSGAIALALASERPCWQIHATDSSQAALDMARQNAGLLGLDGVIFLAGSWCEPLPALAFDMIVSNPPYIASDDPHLQQGDVRFEPQSALVASNGGMADLQEIATQARAKLRVGGLLLLEHGWQQGASTRQLLLQLGYAAVETRRDHGGRERLTLGWNV